MLVVKISENEITERESVLEDLRRAKNKDGWEKEPAYVSELKNEVSDNKTEPVSFMLNIDTKPFKCEQVVHIKLKNKDAFANMTIDAVATGLKGLLEDIIKNDLASFVAMSKKSANDMDFYNVNGMVKRTQDKDGLYLATKISNTRDIKVCDVTLSVLDTVALAFYYNMECETLSDIVIRVAGMPAHTLVRHGFKD